MSDLCHNCGDCHLGSHPTPCPKALNECIICKNYGHTFNFCPLSVRRIDKNYQYWMLCHNCDRWHLPQPCNRDLVTCPNCQNVGHLPSFCPLIPDARSRPLGDTTPANLHRPHNVTSAIRPEAQTFGGFSQMPMHLPLPETSMSTARQHGAQYLVDTTTHSHSLPYGYQQQHQSVAMQTFPTPMPSSATKPQIVITAADPFAEIEQEHQTQEFYDPEGTISPDKAPAILEAPDFGKQPESVRNSHSQTVACASCRKNKRRCSHESDGAIGPTPAEGEEVEQTQPKIKKLKLSVRGNVESETGKRAESTIADAAQEKDADVTGTQRIPDQAPPDAYGGFLRETGGITDDVLASQLRTAVRDMTETGDPQAQTIPSYRGGLGASLSLSYNTGDYLPPIDHTKSSTGGNGAMKQISSAADVFAPPTGELQLTTAEAKSQRSSNVFSFGENGRVDSFGEGEQNADVPTTTESPSGQIQYELTTPVGMAPGSMVLTEAKPAAKPKKAAAPKKKKGGARRKNW